MHLSFAVPRGLRQGATQASHPLALTPPKHAQIRTHVKIPLANLSWMFHIHSVVSFVSRISSSTRTSKVGLDRARRGHTWVGVVRVRLAFWGALLSRFFPLRKLSDFVHMHGNLGSLCSDGP